MKVWNWRDLATFASERSSFYRELYAGCDLLSCQLSDLPIAEQSIFWEANTFKNNRVLTAPMEQGTLFKSGGTTGAPKFSIFTKDEWEAFTLIFGRGMASAGFEKNERVANLFYAGELYASFVFIMKSLEKMPVDVLHFPIAGATSPTTVIKMIEEMGINVLCGVPTSFVSLANELLSKGKTLPVKKIFFGGESLFEDQLPLLQKAFPGVIVRSIGYASVDGGHLGFIDKNCQSGEHLVFPESIVEIVDEESGELILTPHKAGRLIYTNLARSLMPIIRYPVGDKAMWTEDGRFKLLGRSDEGARIGPVTVNRDDLIAVLNAEGLLAAVSGFQLIIERVDGRDRLRVKLAAANDFKVEALTASFLKERPMYRECVEKGLVGQVVFETAHLDQLEKNARTGKLRLVIDRRDF